MTRRRPGDLHRCRARGNGKAQQAGWSGYGPVLGR